MDRARPTGRHQRITVAGEDVAAFIPRPLPPRDPIMRIDGALAERLRAAEQALARLASLAEGTSSSADWLARAFVRKEATLSARLAGVKVTLEEVLAFEAQPGVTRLDASPEVRSVLDCVDALALGHREIASPRGLLSMRMLHEMHERLMRGARGGENAPGEVRRTQTWVGGGRPGNAAYVPPPPQALGELLGALDKYFHAPFDMDSRGVESLPRLVRVGLFHAQLALIHPYLDGNGRMARLLVMLLLDEWNYARALPLYTSLFFEQRRAQVERRLTALRTDGEWEEWTSLFLEGLAAVARDGFAAARELLALVAADRARLLAQEETSIYALRLFEQLPRHPVVTAAGVMKLLDTTKPTAGRAIWLLEAAGVLGEMTGKRRDRAWAYGRYLNVLAAGTSPTDGSSR